MGTGSDLFAQHADGSEIPVDISLTPISLGGRVYIVCSMRHHRARLSENIRVQTTALRSAANGIVITDRAGTIIWVNPAACAISGYNQEDLVGQHTRLLKSGEHGPEFYREIWKTVLNGETWSGTIVNRRKDGSKYHEEQTIAPVIGDDGAITHFIAIKQDVTVQRQTQEALARAYEELEARLAEIERLNQELHDQSIRDPLTGLFNRRYLEETIKRELACVARSCVPLSIAILDVDHFKKINDTHGHARGDQILRNLAELLRRCVRSSDLACRIGGEEFLVVMPGAPLDAALRRAEEWRSEVAASATETGNGTSIRYTVSIGVARHLGPGESFDSCMSRADAALYRAKSSGRNRVVCSEHNMH